MTDEAPQTEKMVPPAQPAKRLSQQFLEYWLKTDVPGQVQEISMPAGVQIVGVHYYDLGGLMILCRGDPSMPKIGRRLIVLGTAMDFPEPVSSYRYAGSGYGAEGVAFHVIEERGAMPGY